MSDAPTAKRRMGIFKKLGIGAAVALVCLALVVLVLAHLVARWEARIRPLSLEEVRKVTSAGRPHEGSRQAGGEDRNRVGRETKSVRTGDGEGVGEAAPPENLSDVAPQAMDGAKGLEPKQPDEMRLAALPTQALLDRRTQWCGYYGFNLTKRKAQLLFDKILGATVYEVRRGNTDYWTRSIPGQVGRQHFDVGSMDTARKWLSEAVRVEADEPMKRYLSADLAWLVDDPRVAVALLDVSLSGPLSATDPEFFESYAPFNAVDLCVVTGSEELAEYYYLRNREVLLKWIAKGSCPPYLETRAWIAKFERSLADGVDIAW